MVERAYHGPEVKEDTLHRAGGNAHTATMVEKKSSHGRASCIVGFEVSGQDQGELRTVAACPGRVQVRRSGRRRATIPTRTVTGQRRLLLARRGGDEGEQEQWVEGSRCVRGGVDGGVVMLVVLVVVTLLYATFRAAASLSFAKAFEG